MRLCRECGGEGGRYWRNAMTRLERDLTGRIRDREERIAAVEDERDTAIAERDARAFPRQLGQVVAALRAGPLADVEFGEIVAALDGHLDPEDFEIEPPDGRIEIPSGADMAPESGEETDGATLAHRALAEAMGATAAPQGGETGGGEAE